MDQRLRLINSLAGGRIDRRQFMARAAALGIAAPALGAFGRSGGWAAAQDAPVQGGRIIIATKEEPSSMDNHVDSAPASGVIYDNIYDQLTTIDPDGVIHPALAESWETIEPTRWRIKLRQGVTWHNGDPFVASDVIYHFNRIFNPDDPGRPAGLLAPYQSSEVVDDNTFDIITDTPYPLLMNDLAPRWQAISTNPRQIEAVGAANYGTSPVGTGAFKLKSWEIGGSLILEANDAYWDGRPYPGRGRVPHDSGRFGAPARPRERRGRLHLRRAAL